MFKCIPILFVLLVTFACSDDDGTNGQVQPSDLRISTVFSEEVQGLVEVSAEAKNAEFYLFDFGIDNGFVRSTDGVVSNGYTEEGTYSITVRANATDNLFIEESREVEIVFEEDILDQGYKTPLDYSGMTRVWNDEFDGNSLDESDWNFELGTGSNGWGNNELQYYRKENTSLNGGYLMIEAKKENFSGQSYTSSRLTTEGKFDFEYGRVDIRAQLPEGQGIWSALWMLGANFSSVGWPKCGEVDIMEMIGGNGRENDVFGTLHWDNTGEYACTCGQGHYTLSSNTFADKFHVFSLIWDESTINWYVDDNLYHTIDITPVDLEEFRNNFFFIFNVAVGGNLPGNPDSSTIFPQQMIVDYVRVFQDQ